MTRKPAEATGRTLPKPYGDTAKQNKVSRSRSRAHPRRARRAHVHASSREQALDLLGPLDQAKVSAEKILLVAEVERLLDPVDPVKVEMIDRRRAVAAILVDDSDVGLVTVSVTPRRSQTARISVVLPAPIPPRNAITVRPARASRIASATSGKSLVERILNVFMDFSHSLRRQR